MTTLNSKSERRQQETTSLTFLEVMVIHRYYEKQEATITNNQQDYGVKKSFYFYSFFVTFTLGSIPMNWHDRIINKELH